VLRARRVDQPRDAEVEQLHHALGGEHGVGRLEVAMQQARSVCRGEPTREPYAEGEHAAPGHGSRQRGERLALEELTDEVRVLADFAHAVNRYHVGVGEPRDRSSLGEECLTDLGRHLLGEDELDRDLTIEQAIVRQVDLPHRALTEGSQQPVVVELGGGLPCGHALKVAWRARRINVGRALLG
jgi:hypothetical protein